jgi:hypothetical protein
MGNSRITEDPRIDPRIKAVVGAIDLGLAVSDAESRSRCSRRRTAGDRRPRSRHAGAAPWSLSSGAPESGLSCHALPATRTAGQQGDRDHDPDQDQEISPRNPVPGLALLGGWLPRRWIIHTVITVIIPETRHRTKTAIERTATTSTATMITTPMINRDGATDSPSTASTGNRAINRSGTCRAE